jgi:hypothetical protein
MNFNFGALFEGLPKWFRMTVVGVLTLSVMWVMFSFSRTQDKTIDLLFDLKRAETLDMIYNEELPMSVRAEACEIYVYEMGQNGANKHYCEKHIWGANDNTAKIDSEAEEPKTLNLLDK